MRHTAPVPPILHRAVLVALATGIALVLLAGCSSGDAGQADAETDAVADLDVAAGLRIELVATGFDRPTQLVAAGEGRFAVAQLAGGENDASGQVLLLDSVFAERSVIQQGLDKPTGIAVVGDRLFVQERNRLGVTSLGRGAPIETVVDDMPNNGRSQGSLTVTDDGALLFDTSGAKRGAERVEGSGILWRLAEPLDWRGTAPEAFAFGFKHAYAHTATTDGRVFSVEMSDGTFDGRRASDELVVIESGDDAGWPFCVDDNRPVTEFGGTAAACAPLPRSHALFGPGATPTAVVVAPWDAGMLLVALWIPGRIVAVPTEPGEEPHRGEVIVEGIESPQSLLVDGDRVLVVDHATGSIYALTAA